VGLTMLKIAIIYICDGDYDVFWKEFYESFEKLFLPGTDKHFFLFSDRADLPYAEHNPKVEYHPVLYRGWPAASEMRFHTFLSVQDELKAYDYIFYMNANMKCNRVITEEEMLPEDRPGIHLIAARHPIIDNMKHPCFYPYERNRRSKAYIPYNMGRYYIMGSFIGGRAADFLKMSKILKNITDMDLAEHITCFSYDESRLNRYIIGRDDVLAVSPAYCNGGFNKKYEDAIVMRNKADYFDVDRLKKVKQHSLAFLVVRKIKRTAQSCVFYLIDSVRYGNGNVPNRELFE
jgi:hypothetical protein